MPLSGFSPSGRRWAARLAVLAAAAGLAPWLAASLHAQGTFTPRQESPEEFAAGAGRDETFYACTPCHGFKIVAMQGLSRRQWEESVDLMIEKHKMPPLEDADRKLILDYLEAQYGPRAPARGGGWQSPIRR